LGYDLPRTPELPDRLSGDGSDTLDQPEQRSRLLVDRCDFSVILIIILNLLKQYPSYKTIYYGMAVICWINTSNDPDYWLIVAISL